MRKILAGIVSAITLTACGLSANSGDPGKDSPIAESHRIPVNTGQGYLFGLTWLTDASLVVGLDPAPLAPGSVPQVWRVQADGTNFSQIRLPNDPDCARTEYRDPARLSDGRIALSKLCADPHNSSAAASFNVVAYDPSTGGTAPLSALQDRVNVGGTSWNPHVAEGVGAHSSLVCANIVRVTSQGIGFFPVALGDGSHRWRLDAEATRAPGADCKSDGRADWPAWSPDGRTIAFFASPAAVGIEGQDRLKANDWQMYFMDPQTLDVKQLLAHLRSPAALSWSPDSQWLVFSGGVSGVSGTWLFRLSTKQVQRLTSDEMDFLAWSPDGSRLAAISYGGQTAYPPHSTFLLIDVKGVTK